MIAWILFFLLETSVGLQDKRSNSINHVRPAKYDRRSTWVVLLTVAELFDTQPGQCVTGALRAHAAGVACRSHVAE